jgi:hypothetical protein
MPDLSDTQLVILSNAFQRDDHAVAAIDKRAATREAITSLIASKHLKIVPKTRAHALWTKNEDGGALGLMLTPKSLKLLGHEPGASMPPIPAAAEPEFGVGSDDAGSGSSATPPEVATGPADTEGPSEDADASSNPSDQENGGSAPAKGKIGEVIALLRRPTGASIADLMVATKWQAHSVRGAISGTLKKKLSLTVISERCEGIRIYRIAG